MRYSGLHALLRGSRSTRRYFLSLPVETQLLLARPPYLEGVHNAEELRQAEACLRQCRRIGDPRGKYLPPEV